MTAKELDANFEANKKRNTDFIDWVERQTGQTIHASEVSVHRNGKRPMSRFAKGLYMVYFKILENSLA